MFEVIDEKKTLSPLQLAAVERIRYFEQKLAEKDIYARTAMELEFTVMDEDGEPIPSALKTKNIKEAEEYLKNNLPKHIQQFGYECLDSDGAPVCDIKYEVNVIDDENNALTHYSPLAVAAATLQLKKKTLASMLRETTCLNTERECLPNFAAHPFPNKNPGAILKNDYRHQSAGLHVNISLYDSNNENLFYHSQNLRDHCIQSILKTQRDAMLMLMPTENSLSRIKLGKDRHNHFVPMKINMGYRKAPVSMALRDRTISHATRIENRLPGADADPYVAMAMTLAAVFDVVEKHVYTTKTLNRSALSNGKHYVNIEPSVGFPSYDIPDTHQGVIDRFKSASRMRDLLGAKLYSMVIDSTEKTTQAR